MHKKEYAYNNIIRPRKEYNYVCAVRGGISQLTRSKVKMDSAENCRVIINYMVIVSHIILKTIRRTINARAYEFKKNYKRRIECTAQRMQYKKKTIFSFILKNVSRCLTTNHSMWQLNIIKP